MALHLDSTFIALKNIIERIMQMVSCPSQSLDLVYLPYQLTVGAASKGPAQSRPASGDCLQTDWVTFLGQEPVQLVSCGLIINLHLIFDDLLDLRRCFWWSSRSNFSPDQTSFSIFFRNLWTWTLEHFSSSFCNSFCYGTWHGLSPIDAKWIRCFLSVLNTIVFPLRMIVGVTVPCTLDARAYVGTTRLCAYVCTVSTLTNVAMYGNKTITLLHLNKCKRSVNFLLTATVHTLYQSLELKRSHVHRQLYPSKACQWAEWHCMSSNDNQQPCLKRMCRGLIIMHTVYSTWHPVFYLLFFYNTSDAVISQHQGIHE